MSLKENVEYIKEELSSEEKFLESSLKAEKFYKKYKTVIFGTLGIVIAFFIISSVVDYSKEQTKKEANILYQNILDGSQDEKTLQELQKLNKELYEIALFKTNKEVDLSVTYLKELQLFQKALKEKDLKTIDALIGSQNFLLKDFALINKAMILIENKQYDKAKTILKSINSDSSVNSLATLLEHFLITK